MEDRNLSFLGSGWSFPPSFADSGRRLQTVTNVENVHESIYIILNTDIGERVMQEDFGGGVKRYMFEQMNERLLHDIKEAITNAVLLHETRVVLNEVEIDVDKSVEGLLHIRLQYTIRENNSRFNMVYPFYINETGRTT